MKIADKIRKLKTVSGDLRARLGRARQREVANANRYYALERIDGVLGSLDQIEEAVTSEPIDTSLSFSLGRGMSEWSSDDRAIELGYKLDRTYTEIYRALLSQ